MIALFLTLAAMFISSYLFYAPASVEVAPALQIILLLLLTVLFLILSFQTVRRRSERIARERISEVTPAAPGPPPATAAEGEVAVAQFLGRLQEKGRLVDFVMDDIARYPDPQVAAAARVVHQGCREVLQTSFDLQPVHGGPEGETVTLGGDYDPRRYRLVGRVPDRAPFRGAVRHRGWRTARVTLPRTVGAGEGAREIIAPAEVEVG